MKAVIICVIGLLRAWDQAGAESLVDGLVRLDSGEPAAGAQVLLFDLTDLRAAPVAVTTDEMGYFALPLGGSALPDRFEMGQNYPNPFNPTTIIPYQLPAATLVRLEVFNILGQHVETLVDGERAAGFHTAQWDATDAAGKAVAAGVYLYRLSADGVRLTRRMVLIDGQAGGSQAVGAGGSQAVSDEASETAIVYGLIVSGRGLVTYVDPAFRVDTGRWVDLVVETLESVSRAKVATLRILGDVNNDQRVDVIDVLLVLVYSSNPFLTLSNIGDTSLGDVNRDGRTDATDARHILLFSSNPSDPSLPEGIGSPVLSGPDLEVNSLSVSDTSPKGGASFTLSATVRNQGDSRSTTTTLRYYQSTDAMISSNDRQVGIDAVGALDLSGTSAESIRLTAPSNPGTYYYGACVGVVSRETFTRNNCSEAVRLTVGRVGGGGGGGGGSGPDLVVESLAVSGSPEAGEYFRLVATVRNQGTVRAEGTTVRYYQSTEAAVSEADTEVGTAYVSRLNPEESSEESAYLAAPSSGGTYYYVACVESVSEERDTENNCSTAVTLTIGSPDLVVASLSVSESPEAGQHFRLLATVRNQGTGQAAGTTVRYYRSTDAMIDTTDTEVTTGYVSRLAAGEASERSGFLTAPLSGGTYYYGACVDGVTAESDTGNNCSEAVTLTIGSPDLVVASLSVSESPEAGEHFRLLATVRNQGTGQAAGTTVRYYRSTDAMIDTTDTEVTTGYVSRLAAGEASERSGFLTAPLSGGTYYYGACVDGVTAESDTGNNCSEAVTLTIGSPDLVVASLSVSESPEAGEHFRLLATVRNQGTGRAAGTTVRYYRSTDAMIDTTDTEVTTGYVSRLAAGEASERSGFLTAPLSGGTYYYGACVDGVTAESDTGNNCSEAVTLTIGSPDLVVASLSVSGSPEAGEHFRLLATVRNQGTGRAAGTTVRYYRSTDAMIDTTDTEVTTGYVSRLAAGEASERSGFLTAPSSGGTYYYGACVDGVTAESVRGNNCSTAATLVIGSPDLIIESPAISNRTLDSGQPFTFSATVRNQGAGRAGATTLRYYRSTDAAIDATDPEVGTGYVSRLAADGTSEKRGFLNAPSSDGTYYFGACVDPVTGEASTRNNCSSPVAATVVRTTIANQAPTFEEGSNTTRSLAENTTGTQDIGTRMRATDAEKDRLTYSLEGADAGSFDIVRTSGQLQTRPGVSYDYETKRSHSVRVRVEDGQGSATIAVRIALLDVAEAPGRPAAPTVAASTLNSLSVRWTAPDNTGPAISGYDVQYRGGSSGGFTDWSHSGTGTATTITGLATDTAYEVQVRATNDEGTGDWSPSVHGTTTANQAPTFSEGSSTTRSVAENTTGTRNVGSPVRATDSDGDRLTYSLEGTDAESFNIVSSSGQLHTRSGAAYDHETKSSHSVRVRAEDGQGGSATIDVEIALLDVAEAPGRPSAPTVTLSTLNSLSVTWTAPDNTGPEISDYDVQYRVGSSGGFTDWAHSGTGTSTSIRDLTRNTRYEVQVRASNDEGTGDWSTAIVGRTTANQAPIFSEGSSATRSLAENAPDGRDVGNAVSATDSDGGTLTHSLEGPDAPSFAIVPRSGQLRTREGISYDYEANDRHSVRVRAVDGQGGSAAIDVTIRMEDKDEPPGRPAAPTVTASTLNSLSVTWTAPDNTGPDISDYDVQYRAGGGGAFTDWAHSGTGTVATITGLAPGTSYEVQVRASNAEGTGDWSHAGHGRSTANQAPAFSEGSRATRSVTENTPAGRDIGNPLSATDSDGDRLTYSLEGQDVASFDIVSTSGQLRTRSGVTYNYEADDRYSVRVRVEDGEGGNATTEVTISVEDEDEPPARPAAPTVTASTLNSLSLRWTAPANTGPDISDYDVQYRAGGGGAFTDWAHSGTGTVATITGLVTGTVYEVQVRARSAEGDGPWSPSIDGRTTANQAPAFSESSPMRSVAENTAARQDIEYPVSATDSDGGTLTYRLEGPDAASFDIVSSSGQLRTRAGVSYNYEADDSYSVRVRADDGQGGNATTEVTISVEDVDEPPARPAAPTVTASTLNSLTVRWTAPANTGPALSDYDVQYRAGRSGGFTPWPHNGTGTATTITDLATGAAYEVQVRARNAEGDSPWSPSVEGRTTANQAPTFSEFSPMRSVAENTAAGRDIGNPVIATDSDGGTLTYRLEGPDAASFDIVSSSGQLRTRAGVSYNYEVHDSYSVRVRADDGQGGSSAIEVSINVTDDYEPPARPAAPTVTGSTLNSLSVSWTAPANTGPDISGYDVHYRAAGRGGFVDWAHNGRDTAATITGLVPGTSYEVQVRAANDEGTGEWSPSGRGRTTANQAPAFSEGSRATRSVAENAPAGGNIGNPVSATDGDGGTLTYSLEGPDAASFDIVSSSGHLRTRQGVSYDYEMDDSYSARVRVEDSQGGSATIEVTIIVSDVYEPPRRPSAPTVAVSTSNSLSVRWAAPGNTGPAISDYDVQYRTAGSGSFTPWAHTGNGTATTITGLVTGTAYEVQVRASNDEGTGDWSPSGNGTTTANQAPTFSERSAVRRVAENAPAGRNIGNPVSATDRDGGTLTYSLEGPDAASFDIVSSSGQLRTRAGIAYDHETKIRHQVGVRVQDGQGGSAAIEVAIDVEDENEPPGRSPAPTVMASTLNSLSLTWTAPANTGPALSGYDVQYRAAGSGAFTDWTHNGTDQAAIITGLVTGTAYEVQVRAINDEGTGGWSPSGHGRTTANQAPTFSEGSRATRSVAENTPGGRNIGNPVRATDSDGGTLTYSLEGPDAANFDIVSGSGQLRTRAGVPYDHEADDRYSVRVRVEDGQGGSATIDAEITLIDENEPPRLSAAPTVTVSTSNSLSLTWTAPDNTGPAISGYDVQYRTGGSGGFTDWDHSGTGRATTITGLVTGTAYEVRVRASNDEGTGEWSPEGSGATTANQAPGFSEGSRATRSVAENTPGGRNIGNPVSATDGDGGTLTYSLEGPDAASFDIVSSSGQLRTKAGVSYNYEVDDNYSVRVHVEDGQGGSATIAVTINVTDQNEPPGRPSAPTVTASTSNSLSLTWTAPDNIGPALSDYDAQYRAGGGAFTGWAHNGTGTATTITGLVTGTAYEVQVRASNDEGTGEWSPSGSGTTIANQAPAFSEGASATRRVAENTPSGQDIGPAVSATDGDGGTLTYSLEGPDAASFDIVSSSGQLRTRGVSYNYEVDGSYSVHVRVEDGQGGSATIAVTIDLTDRDEPPDRPPAPMVTASTLNSLSLTWTAPDNIGPALSDYDAQYRAGGGAFTGWAHNGTGTATTITGLLPGTAYEVQVRASNDEGTGKWSPEGSGTTAANQAPAFTEGPRTTRSVAESTPAGRDVGHPVSATDGDGGTLTYSLEGPDAGSFDIVSSSGQLRTRAGIPYNYEADDRYSVRVRAEDGQGGSATIDVEITLMDQNEPPHRPAAPTVTASTSNSLSLTWRAPENTGPALSSYEVQYRAGSSGGFVHWAHSGTGTATTITGLTADTAYEVQVRAANDEGTGDWSPSGSGRTGGAGLAPVDQDAFNRLVARRVLISNYFIAFPYDGRFVENNEDTGSYRYSSTGPNVGTLAQYYDEGQFGGSCSIQLTFTSTTTGTTRYKCGSADDYGASAVWQLSDARDPDFFDIEVVWSRPEPSEANKGAFEAAAARWEQVITRDIPDHVLRLNDGKLILIDDLAIIAKVEEIDGPGGTIGETWVEFRKDPLLPAIAGITLDEDNLSSLSPTALQHVVLHEMGHALGFGFWERSGLLENPSLDAEGRPIIPAPDTHFSGPRAIAAFDAVGGSTYTGKKVPVENESGGQGTQDGHWRRSVFGPNELMEGYDDTEGVATEPLSAITIQSLADLGYVADLDQADPYTLPPRAAAKLAVSSAGLIPLNCILGRHPGGPIVIDGFGVIEDFESVDLMPGHPKSHDFGTDADEEPIKRKPRRPKVLEK